MNLYFKGRAVTDTAEMAPSVSITNVSACDDLDIPRIVRCTIEIEFHHYESIIVKHLSMQYTLTYTITVCVIHIVVSVINNCYGKR